MKTFLFLILFVLSLGAGAQSILDQYIKDGLKNNIVLQQKTISLEKALFDLKEANALFLPSFNLTSSYSSGKGGRYFNFPLGDLMNPVYNKLNDLTESSN